MGNPRRYIPKLSGAALMLAPCLALLSQTPTHYPTGKNPQPFTFWNVFFYIVIPVILVVAWIGIRRYQSRKAKEDQESGGQGNGTT